MLSKLTGGTLYDPAQQLDGEIRDIFIREGFIVPEPGADTRFNEILDVSGKVVMAGVVDIHSYIAGGNVNTARLMLPEQHRNHMARRMIQPFRNAKWPTTDADYRYARMG
jgi:formylmethanofuran dehydrogenase subunit A